MTDKRNLPLAGLKICFLSSIPLVTARLFYRQCTKTAEDGAQVVLISPISFTPHAPLVSLKRYRSLRGPLGRMLSSVLILRPALQEAANVYHVHTIQLLPLALSLKCIWRKHVIYDMFEDYPSMVEHKTEIPPRVRRLLRFFVTRLESAACAILDAIVTADPNVMRVYSRQLRAHRRLRKNVFYNFPEVDFAPPVTPHSTQAVKPYDIVYSGGISERTGMFVLLDALQLLASDGIRPRVLIFGYADNSQFPTQLLTRASAMGIADCLTIRGRVPPMAVAGLLQQAKIGVAPLQATPKFLNNIPTKVFEYWACGLPTVASDLPPLRPFHRRGIYGFTFAPSDSASLARHLALLLGDSARAAAMGRSAQEAVASRLNATSERDRLYKLYLAISRLS